jgi:hypothetical protein
VAAPHRQDYSQGVGKGLSNQRAPLLRSSGGRTWWAHFEFTPINTEPTILRTKVEEILHDTPTLRVRDRQEGQGAERWCARRDAERSSIAAVRTGPLSGAPTPITYAGTRSEELLAQDKLIAAYPITVQDADVRILPIDKVFQ